MRVCREGDGEGVREMVRVYGEMVWGVGRGCGGREMVRVCVGREVVRVCREGDWEGV